MDHGEAVEGLAWLEEGRIAIAAGGRGVRAWDVREGRVVAEDRSHAKTVSALCVANTPGGIRVLTGGLDGLIRVYDRDLNLLHGLDHGSPVSALAFSVDARAIAIGSTDGMVSVRKRQAESVKRTRQKTAYSPLSEGDAIVRIVPVLLLAMHRAPTSCRQTIPALVSKRMPLLKRGEPRLHVERFEERGDLAVRSAKHPSNALALLFPRPRHVTPRPR